MALQVERLRACHPRRNPDLPHVVRLARRGVALDAIFDLTAEDLAIGVTCKASRRLSGKDNNDGP